MNFRSDQVVKPLREMVLTVVFTGFLAAGDWMTPGIVVPIMFAVHAVSLMIRTARELFITVLPPSTGSYRLAVVTVIWWAFLVWADWMEAGIVMPVVFAWHLGWLLIRIGVELARRGKL
jgi:hypothetical protein